MLIRPIQYVWFYLYIWFEISFLSIRSLWHTNFFIEPTVQYITFLFSTKHYDILNSFINIITLIRHFSQLINHWYIKFYTTLDTFEYATFLLTKSIPYIKFLFIDTPDYCWFSFLFSIMLLLLNESSCQRACGCRSLMLMMWWGSFWIFLFFWRSRLFFNCLLCIHFSFCSVLGFFSC